VRQKNKIVIFLSYIFLSGWSGVAETMIKASKPHRKLTRGWFENEDIARSFGILA
jgi:hypothetical protein